MESECCASMINASSKVQSLPRLELCFMYNLQVAALEEFKNGKMAV